MADGTDPAGLGAATDIGHLLPAGSALAELLAPSPPFDIPWAGLAESDGWSVWLGHPPVPAGIAILPAPPELVWGDPSTVLATAVAGSLRYALLRGADSFVAAAGILQREGPVSLIVPGDLSPVLAASLAECSALGIPILTGAETIAGDLGRLRQRRVRRDAHAVDLGRPHDPALSGQRFVVAGSSGGDSLSSFVLHDEGEVDRVRITGTPSARIAIEIGVRGEGIDLAAALLLEDDAARMPGFLDGVTSARSGDSLRIDWADGRQPDAQALGLLWQIWLKAIWGATLVDVRIAFAPEDSRSDLLIDMRTRSARRHADRTASLSGCSGEGPGA